MSKDKAPPIDLSEFETHVRVRPMRMEDYPRIVELALACFPGMQPWMEEQIASQLSLFPEGQLVVEYEDQVVASSSSLIVDFDDYEDWQDWKVIADNGYIRNHDPEGDSLYGIEIMVDPEYRGLKLARRLYEARKALCRDHNLRRIIIGGRIPGYGAHAGQMGAAEYVDEVLQRNLYDPVLTTQLANGFHLARLIPDYFPADEASRGYATFLVWNNIEYSEDGLHRTAANQRARLCLVQYRMRAVESWDEFASQVKSSVDIASGYAGDFVVFPELFLMQLQGVLDTRAPAEVARALAERTPDYLELMTDLAVSFNVNIVGGSQFTVEDGRLYNVGYLFRRDGTIGRQYKIHPTPAERKWWGVNPGRRVQVFETDRGRAAILVGDDVVFPELGRIAAAGGAQLLFVPYAVDERYGCLRIRHCAQARAIENQLYAATAGSAGIVPFVVNFDLHYAQSGIYTPADFAFPPDAVAGEAMPNIETVVVHDLDLDLLRRNRQAGTVRPWTDRDPEVYAVRYRDPDAGPREC